MEVHVKGSPNIEVTFESQVIMVEGSGIVDTALSLESENPVMNKIITAELNQKATKTELSALETKVTETDTKLAELSAKVNELDKGEAYIMGDTLTFRNYADASIEGETLKL